jgi:acetyltransferase
VEAKNARKELISLTLYQTLETMFYPRSIAVVGASSRETQFSHGVLKGLREAGFPGAVYPVNPRLQELLGFRVYPSVADIPGPVDLVMVGVPVGAVMDVVHQCGQKKTPAMVVFTSGFAELGGDGVSLERHLIDTAHGYGMRFMGPNCFGVACAGSRLTYRNGVPLDPGRGGLICQSGSMAWSLALLAAERGVYFDKTASIGNSADLDAADFLAYMGQDDRIDFVCVYLEGLRDGRRFFEVLRETCRHKPVILWKAGRTAAGSRAAASHTAALSGEAHVFRAVARQAGALWAQSLDDTVDLIVGVANIGVPQGRRIGVVSGPGAAGVATADACEELGLPLAVLGPETEAELRSFLPPFASPRNPVDLTAAIFDDMSLYTRATKVVMRDEGVDLVFIMGPSEIEPELFAAQVSAEKAAWSKPALVPWIASDRAFESGAQVLRRSGVACFKDPARAAWTIARLLEYGQFRQSRGLPAWGGVASV